MPSEDAHALALGVPRWRVSLTVMVQSFWVGLFGIVVCRFTLWCSAWATLARQAGTQVVIRWEITAGAAVVTMATAPRPGPSRCDPSGKLNQQVVTPVTMSSNPEEPSIKCVRSGPSIR